MLMVRTRDFDSLSMLREVPLSVDNVKSSLIG